MTLIRCFLYVVKIFMTAYQKQLSKMGTLHLNLGKKLKPTLQQDEITDREGVFSSILDIFI